MRLFLFALLFRFDKKLFYLFVLRTISTFNSYAYCDVAWSVVNIQHSTGCLIVCFPGMTSLLPKVNRSLGAHFQTFFLKIFLFFDLPQYSNRFDYIRDRRRAVYFNNQKNHCISSLNAAKLPKFLSWSPLEKYNYLSRKAWRAQEIFFSYFVATLSQTVYCYSSNPGPAVGIVTVFQFHPAELTVTVS